MYSLTQSCRRGYEEALMCAVPVTDLVLFLIQLKTLFDEFRLGLTCLALPSHFFHEYLLLHT